MKTGKLIYAMMAVAVSALLVSCGTSNRVASSFSKRKYMKGNYVDHTTDVKTATTSAQKVENANKPAIAATQNNTEADKELNTRPKVKTMDLVMQTFKNLLKKNNANDPITASVANKAYTDPNKSLNPTSDKSVLAPTSIYGGGQHSGGGDGGNAKLNWAAITGFVCAFFFPILGIIFSAIGLPSERHGLAEAGLIISIAWFVIAIILIVVIASSYTPHTTYGP